MSRELNKKISSKYCARFGQIAVELNYVSEVRLKEAICLQVDDDIAGREHRLIGTIMFENDWMTSEQIEAVLNMTLKKMREETGSE